MHKLKNALVCAIGCACSASAAVHAAALEGLLASSAGSAGALGRASNTELFASPDGLMPEPETLSLKWPLSDAIRTPAGLIGDTAPFEANGSILASRSGLNLSTALFGDNSGRVGGSGGHTGISNPDSPFGGAGQQKLAVNAGDGAKFSLAVSTNAWVALSGLGEYDERTTAEDVEAIAKCFTMQGSPNCTTVVADSWYVDAAETGTDGQAGDSHSRGAYFTEIGLSLVRGFGQGGSAYVFGLTPKYVMADIVNYSTALEGAAGASTEEVQVEKRQHFDADLGISKRFGNGWRTGLVVQNILARDYESGSRALQLSPHAHFGLARPINW